MLDLLLAVVAVAVLGALAVAALVAVTVAPFVVALQRADAVGASPVRVGALTLAASGVGAALAVLGPRPLAVALLLPWLVPVLVGRVPLGRRGRHV